MKALKAIASKVLLRTGVAMVIATLALGAPVAMKAMLDYTPQDGVSIIPDNAPVGESLVSKHNCWTSGNHPFPGHVVMVVKGKAVYLEGQHVEWALNNLGSHRIIAFCK